MPDSRAKSKTNPTPTNAKDARVCAVKIRDKKTEMSRCRKLSGIAENSQE
jgi:hypothetical protein